MKDIALILMSHGNMASEALKSAEMIVGKVNNAYAISMEADEGMSGISLKLDAILKETSVFSHTFVIVDLLGGTPCNVALEKLTSLKNVTLISGLTLAMIIEFAMSQYDDYEKLKEHLIEVGRNGIKDIPAVLSDNLDE